MTRRRTVPSSSIFSQLLVAFVLLVLAPAIVISVTSAVTSSGAGLQHTLVQLDSVVTLKSAEMDMWTDELGVGLDMLLGRRDMADTVLPLLQGRLSLAEGRLARGRLLGILDDKKREMRLFDHICLMDANGRVVVSTDPALDGQDLRATVYYQQGLQKNFITTPFRDEDTRRDSSGKGRLIVVAAHPVVAVRLGAVGVLAGFSDISVLDRIMREPMGLGKTGESYLVGSDYLPLTPLRSLPDPAVAEVRSLGARLAVESKLRGHSSYSDYRGVPVLGAYAWLPLLQVALIVELDQAEAFGPVTTMSVINLGVALVAVLLAIFAAAIVTRGLSAPLRALSATATRIASGDLGHTADLDRRDEIGNLAEAFNNMTSQLRRLIEGQQAELVERGRVEAELRASEERNRAVLQSAMDGFWRVDTRGRLLEVNQAYCQMSGYSEQELLSKRISDLEAVEAQAETSTHIEKVMAQGEDRFETRHIRKDGSGFEVEVSVQYRHGQDDSLFAFLRDITGRKQAEEQIRKSLAEKETLLRELHHRTKNNMGIIIALLNMQEAEIQEERLRAAFTDVRNRISSMALVHQKLYEAHDLSHLNLKNYIGDLSVLLTESYIVSAAGVSVTMEMEDVFVLIDTAIPCGLILNELVSNALKYAFPDGRGGEIKIMLRRLGSGEIRLQVADSGVGLPPGFDIKRDGHMGLQTIANLGEHQLGGKVSFDTRQGLACEILFRDDQYQPRV